MEQINKGSLIIYGLGGAAKYGGLTKSDNPRRGGRKILDASRRGGQKILHLINFFSMFLKHNFFMFWGYFGHFSFLGPRGGAKNFRRVAKGGAKF